MEMRYLALSLGGLVLLLIMLRVIGKRRKRPSKLEIRFRWPDERFGRRLGTGVLLLLAFAFAVTYWLWEAVDPMLPHVFANRMLAFYLNPSYWPTCVGVYLWMLAIVLGLHGLFQLKVSGRAFQVGRIVVSTLLGVTSLAIASHLIGFSPMGGPVRETFVGLIGRASSDYSVYMISGKIGKSMIFFAIMLGGLLTILVWLMLNRRLGQEGKGGEEG